MLLAVGGKDSEIIIYHCKNKYKIAYKIRAHNAPIVNMDFSDDGKILYSTAKIIKLSLMIFITR